MNESPFGFFQPSRGVHQGDPLSSYLFILGMEVLSQLLPRKGVEGKIYRVSVGHGCPPISHLMFMDDLVLFCRVDASEVEELKKCLVFTKLDWGKERITERPEYLAPTMLCQKS